MHIEFFITLFNSKQQTVIEETVHLQELHVLVQHSNQLLIEIIHFEKACRFSLCIYKVKVFLDSCRLYLASVLGNATVRASLQIVGAFKILWVLSLDGVFHEHDGHIFHKGPI